MPHDGRMFNNTGRKGELFELKQQLNATDPRDRKKAVKRVVAAMTLGRDVSSLFPDVIKNAMTDNLAMKKLVYLYIINYARANPDLVILVINFFVKDASDPNPLIRALSIRTMALIRLEKVTEYLIDPLHKALGDQDPYVRKTAAVCVAKLFDTDPAIVAAEGFIPLLQNLLSDSNPMTIANAVAALAEIADASGNPSLLKLSASSVPKYLSALGECTEWGQVFILDALATYTPASSDEARNIIERIIPRMQHANPAVVLAAVRMIVALMPMLTDDPETQSSGDEARNFLINKMRNPIITLLNSPPEMQFVALRNINLLLRTHPSLFAENASVFYVAYNDPFYVKVEKLDMLVRLASPSSARQILSELKEYASEVDEQFVRRAVTAIGRIAVRLASAAPAAVAVLMSLLESRTATTVEPIAVAMADILRAYPGQHDGSIPALLDSAESIAEPSARCALVWIVGELAGKIPRAPEMIAVFADTLSEEPHSVQLAILTAAVKVYLTCGGDKAHGSLQRVLAFATGECENFDVRERGVVYGRMLGAEIDAARKVVLAAKPGIKDVLDDLDPALHKELMGTLGSIAAVYRQPVARFRGVLERSAESGIEAGAGGEEDLLGLEVQEPAGAPSTENGVPAIAPAPAADGGGLLGIDDFLGGGGTGNASSGAVAVLPIAAPSGGSGAAGGAGLLDDLFGPTAPTAPVPDLSSKSTTAVSNGKILLPSDKGHGLQVRGGLVRKSDGSLSLDFQLENVGGAAMSQFAIELRKNAFGFVVAAPMVVSEPIAPGGICNCVVPLGSSPDADIDGGSRLQMAFRFTAAGASKHTIVYCSERLVKSLDMVLEAQQGRMDKAMYLKMWSSTPDAQEVVSTLTPTAACEITDPLAVMQRLESGRVFLVAKRRNGNSTVLYLSALVLGPLHCLLMAELTLPASAGQSAKLASRSPIGAVAKPFLDSLGATCQRLLE